MEELKSIPEAPKGMNEVAAGFWKRKCKDLYSMGKLNASLLESLQAYCNHLSDMQRAREQMDLSWGMSSDFQRYQKIYIEANKQQIVLAKEFGFTPASSKNMPKTQKKKKSITDGL
jgi:phage terminase small subunit